MTYIGLPVLWDLDGTLADSSTDIAAAVDRAFVALHLPVLGTEAVRRHVGSGARHLITNCLAESLAARVGPVDAGPSIDVVLPEFLASYRDHIADHTTLHAGVRELLADLRVPQAVVTNKPITLTRALLAALDVTHRFAAVFGGESVLDPGDPCGMSRRKPDPAMIHAAMAALGVDRAVIIGDGPHDVGAGRAAGIPVIGVDWGIATPTGADVRVQTVDALRGLLLG